MTRRRFPLVDSLIGTPSTGPRLGAAALLPHGIVIELYADEACTTPLDATDLDGNPIGAVIVDGVTIPRFLGPDSDDVTVYGRRAGGTGLGFPMQAIDTVQIPPRLSEESLAVQFAQGVQVKPGASASDNVAILADAMTSAAAFGAPIIPIGVFPISGPIVVPANTKIDGRFGTLKQTAPLTTALSISTAGVTVSDLSFVGLASDYVNTSAVYNSSAIALGAATDLLIENCKITGYAGAGIQSIGAADRVRIVGNVITGPGADYIPAVTGQYSAGIRWLSGGTWEAAGNEITGYAQGVVTTTGIADFRITNNYIHDIPGQHGLYIGSCKRAVISNNTVDVTAILGMKIQIGPGDSETDSVAITGNVFTNVGDTGILLTNTGREAGDPARLRRVSVLGNVVTNAGSDGIQANSLVGASILGNILTNVRAGVSLIACSDTGVTHNRIKYATQQGIKVESVADVQIEHNRIIDPASANGSTSEHGIHAILTNTDLVIHRNRITDSLGNMRYGIYIADATTMPTLEVTDNYTTGASDYGIRFAAAAPVRGWRGNVATGVLGTVLNRPTSGYGRQGREFFDSAIPTAGRYELNDLVWNIAPVAGGPVGWICAASGSPGTWRAWGRLDLSAIATLDFPSVAAGGSQELGIVVSGAAVGDVVQVGPPATIEAGLVWGAYVSAANTVKVRVSNLTAAAIDPASASWKVTVGK